MQDNSSYRYLVDNKERNETYYNNIKKQLHEALKDIDVQDFIDLIENSIEAAKISGKDMNIEKVRNFYHLLDAVKNKKLIDYDSVSVQSVQYREPSPDWDFADIKILSTLFSVSDKQKEELARLINLSDLVEIEAAGMSEVALRFYVTDIWRIKH